MQIPENIIEEVLLRKIITEFRSAKQSILDNFNAEIRPVAEGDSLPELMHKVFKASREGFLPSDLLSARHGITAKYSADLQKCYRSGKYGLLDYIAFCDLDFEQSDAVLVANLQMGIAQIDRIHWFTLFSVSDHFERLLNKGHIGPFLFLRYMPQENGVDFRKWLLASIGQECQERKLSLKGSLASIIADQFSEDVLNAMAMEGGYFALCHVHTGYVLNPHELFDTAESEVLLRLRCAQYFNLLRFALQWAYLPGRGITSCVPQAPTIGQSAGVLFPTAPTCSARITNSLWLSFTEEFNWGAWGSNYTEMRFVEVIEERLSDYSNLLESGSHNLLMRKLNDSITFVFSSFGMKGDDPIVGLVVAIESILNPFKSRDLPPSERFARLGAALITDQEMHRRTIYEDLRSAYIYRNNALHSMEGYDIQLKLDDLTRDPTQHDAVKTEDEPEPIPHHEQENMMFEYYLRLFVAVSRWLSDYSEKNGDQPDWRLRRDFESYCVSEMQPK